MHLQTIKLTNFRNYEFQEMEFSPRLNLIAGLNGMGKTNILDAVYYLCMSKSQFTGTDRNVVRQGEDFFRLEGHFLVQGKQEKIVAKVQPGKLKVMERNNAAYDRMADHIGLLPVVFKAPDDTALALDGSEERRRFLDNTLSQIDPAYLRHLIQYNKVLQNRNALLKQFAEQRFFDAALLEALDLQLPVPAAYIFEKRKNFVADLEPIFNQNHQTICGSRETVSMAYRSQLADSALPALLAESRDKDRAMQRTTAGIHRDDLGFKLEGRPLKSFASQGQLKSFVLALKLAQYRCLEKEKGLSPILLLDDLFDKLDDDRVGHLLDLLVHGGYGQVFITDTHPERSEVLARQFAGTNYRKFMVENGKAVEASGV